jgi:endonuclease/exonuclease/phosphatase family metal-dependent hydrolase
MEAAEPMVRSPAAPRPLDATRFDRWLWSPARAAWLAGLTAELRRHATRTTLEAAPFWRRESRRLTRFLGRPQSGAPGSGRPPWQAAWPRPAQQGQPRQGPPGRLRIVHWNILKGVAFEQILALLNDAPRLRRPDILLLNEVDLGMARSGNRHVAAELGAALGMHWLFLPTYLELTKGPGCDAEAPGENRIGLHGLAILSREPLYAALPVALPECFDMFAFGEKRLGGRAGLLARPARGPWIGCVHLEVRGTPTCRARQAAALLAALEQTTAGEGTGAAAASAVLIGGDLNTHTFPRGTLGARTRGYVRLLAHSRGALRRQLAAPWRGGREPLFAELARHGFTWEAFNESRPTAVEQLGRIEEATGLARAAATLLLALLGGGGRTIPLRLDWFAGRGVTPLAGVPPVTVGELTLTGVPSDHLPIAVDLAWPSA